MNISEYVHFRLSTDILKSRDYLKKKKAHIVTMAMDMKFRIRPTCIISFCLMYPVPMTMAFGGVATGNINAQEAPMPMTMISASGGRPSCTPIGANSGTSKAAEAVFEVNSVKKIMNAVIAKITTNIGATDKALAICSPNKAEAPEVFMTSDRAIPPPKSMSTPQSVLSDTCFQLTRPHPSTATAAAKAMMVSGDLNANISPSCLPKIHDRAVATKTTMVKIRDGVHGMTSSLMTTFCFRLGFKKTYIAPSSIGSMTSIIGTPNFIHSIKLSSNALAAIPFGGEPIIVPRPPMLAQ